MSVRCLVHNFTAHSMPSGFLIIARRLLRIVEQVTGQNFTEVNLVLVDKLAIRYLNYTYRQHNKVTDILSFSYTPQPVTGDLIICFKQVKEQANRYHVSLNQELIKLIIHGYLHLLGYDHIRVADRRIMRLLEKQIRYEYDK